jgi:ribonuclease HI
VSDLDGEGDGVREGRVSEVARSGGIGEAGPEAGAEEPVAIHTDGACKGNPGPGGWGALLCYRGREKRLFGGEGMTTNNRMEMMAAIRALEVLRRPTRVRLTTDSQYVCKGIREWLPRWKARGFRTANREPVKNQDLWQRLDLAAARHRVEWLWVRGHDGDPGNEEADRLAVLGASRSAAGVTAPWEEEEVPEGATE